MAEKVRISHIGELSLLQAAIRAKGFPCNVTITGAGRSLPQNALFHKWCGEVAQFFVRMGKVTFATGAAMNDENVKRNLKQTFLGEEPIESINLQTGEVTVRYELRHTSQLDKGAMHAFMTCIDAWAQDHGIYLSHPEDSEYMRIRCDMGGGSMSQFKPGDLAMIVGANYLIQNIGKVVELSAFVQDGDLYAGPNGRLYRHSDIGCWIVRGEGVQFRADDDVCEGFGVCEERHLMPLPGDASPANQQAKAVSA